MPLSINFRPWRRSALALAVILAGRSAIAATIIGSSTYDTDPSPGAGYEYTDGFDFAGYGNGGPNKSGHKRALRDGNFPDVQFHP